MDLVDLAEDLEDLLLRPTDHALEGEEAGDRRLLQDPDIPGEEAALFPDV